LPPRLQSLLERRRFCGRQDYPSRLSMMTMSPGDKVGANASRHKREMSRRRWTEQPRSAVAEGRQRRYAENR
jgi:hypothetical protein